MLLYALTIVVSAFLLFQVQPVIAKIILPWFGGSAAVWTTCLLFFQLVLLLGYLYAHALVRYLKPKTQLWLHAGLLLVSAATLPIYPRLSWKPSGTENPTMAIIFLLGLTVGLPYFLLSSTGPLLQAWYARRFQGKIPYRLYALSNAGSMFALISYPALFEPVFGTHMQAWLWSGSYVLFMILCGLTAFHSVGGGSLTEDQNVEEVPRPTTRQMALWVALPACASVLLLAVTNHLSQNVAAIPFLWVLPLAIYLLTFILCFEGEGWYRRNPYLQLLAVALASMSISNSVDSSGSVPIKIMLPLFSIGLYTCCMVCHGELVRLKPHPRYLTHFFVMISAGGAVGGLLVGLVAPYLFRSLYELLIGLGACAILTLMVLQGDTEYDWFKGIMDPARILMAAWALAVAGFAIHRWQDPIVTSVKDTIRLAISAWQPPERFEEYTALATLALIAAIVLVILHEGKLRGVMRAFTAELVALVLVGYLVIEARKLVGGYRLTVRNFYGALKVRDSGSASDLGAVRTLTHGTINHGEQFLHPTKRNLPTTYYGPNTGVGIAIREEQKRGAIRVGVIGLGTGTLAAYGREGDYYRFYEINPLVPGIARGQFFFLPDCKAKVEIALGDARLSLEREADEHFDVLAVDAFSSDSIPVHLLTKEAMLLFFRHLNPNGLLAVHISNRYLNLRPVLWEHAKAIGTLGRMADTDDDTDTGVFGSTWVLLAKPSMSIPEAVISSTVDLATTDTIRLWTDDYSNLFQILK